MTAVSHERLTALVRYDPETGGFWPRVARMGVKRTQPLGHAESNGYIRIGIDHRRYLAHRLAWFYMTAEWPSLDVDHKNMSRGDNSWANLRLATDSQNHMNSVGTRGRSGLKGAHWNETRGYWQSYIKAHGVAKFLGRFDTPEAAHAAYVKAATELHGEFLRLAA